MLGGFHLLRVGKAGGGLIRDRERVGREANPSVGGLLDSQSVKTTEPGGPRGGACPRARRRRDPGDAGKKVKGRKRRVEGC